jgi:hypothetical protein
MKTIKFKTVALLGIATLVVLAALVFHSEIMEFQFLIASVGWHELASVGWVT